MAKKKTVHFYHPRNWLLLWLLSNLWLFNQMPIKIQLAIGRWLGRLTMRFSKNTRNIAVTNVKKCFPELSDQEQQELMVKTFESAGMGMIETTISWWVADKKIKHLFKVNQSESITKAHEEGKRIILLCPHLSCLFILGRLFSMNFDLAVMYNQVKHPVIEVIHRDALKRYYVDAFRRDELRAALRALRNKTPLFYTPDIDPGPHSGVFAPFFGIETYTLTATAKIAAMKDTVVILCGFYRCDDNQGYELYTQPPLENFPSGDPRKDATRINEVMEELIRKKPEQYFWTYKSFKTRPAGEPDFYQ